MKVRLSLDFNDYARYVIAKFYAPAATSAQDKARPRATRHQVRRFVEAHLLGEDGADLLGGRHT